MREARGFGNNSTEAILCSEDDGCTRTPISRCVSPSDWGLSFPNKKRNAFYVAAGPMCVYMSSVRPGLGVLVTSPIYVLAQDVNSAIVKVISLCVVSLC